MPNDEQLKRVSNLLNALQVRTALESTNVSPQYLSNETARRDAIKLEKQGNQIDPVTKKPKKYSEKWLQSTGQQIPGLDSEGTSAINALDIVGAGQLAKVLGQIGKQGVKKVLKDLTLKETVGGSPVKLPSPSKLVKKETDTPFFDNDDYVGELMNLGTKRDGIYNNHQVPISVREWRAQSWRDDVGNDALPLPTRLVRTYLNKNSRMTGDRYYNIKANLAERNRYAGISNDDVAGMDVNGLFESNYDNGWTDGFRIVDSPTQTRLPYFSKIADDINKGLAERLAGKEMQLQVEPTNYGFKTNIKGKVGDIEYSDWRQAGTMGLNPSGNALTKGDMLLKPVTDAQNGVDAVFANSSFPFSNLPNTNALIGKGYGKELYRQLNASLKKEYGTRLNSGHNSLSEHSRALWNSLVDKGEAWRIGDPRTTVQYGLYGGLLGTALAGQKEK